jgi:L-tyrosine isonitrile synthase
MQRRIDHSDSYSAQHRPDPQMNPSAQSVVDTFNTWYFKREQPADRTLLLQSIARAIQHSQPVSFVLYWGKGERNAISLPDVQCLDYLQELTSRIASVYSAGACLTLIFTDTHAALNGFPVSGTARYFSDMRTEAERRNLSTSLLSEVVSKAPSENCHHDNDDIPPELLATLTASAQKWYGGELGAREGAIAYYRQNMIEKRAVQDVFPHSVFITFNGRTQRLLFPNNLPIFYMYSLRRGIAVKPWFMPSPE